MTNLITYLQSEKQGAHLDDGELELIIDIHCEKKLQTMAELEQQ